MRHPVITFIKLDIDCFKGQLISKANCQAEDSSKKRTNEFVFTSMRRVFVRFSGESSARKKKFRDYLTFNKQRCNTNMGKSANKDLIRQATGIPVPNPLNKQTEF